MSTAPSITDLQKAIAEQLKRLSSTGSPQLRRQAALGVFVLLRRHPLPSAASASALSAAASAHREAAAAVLASPHPEVVDEGCEQLLRLASVTDAKGGWAAGDALDLLLNALERAAAAASSAAAPPPPTLPLLARAASAAFFAAARERRRLGQDPFPRWSAHPLSAAALCHPAAAGPAVVSAAVAAFSAAVSALGRQQQQPPNLLLPEIWADIEPFVDFVLLAPSLGACARRGDGSAAEEDADDEDVAGGAGGGGGSGSSGTSAFRPARAALLADALASGLARAACASPRPLQAARSGLLPLLLRCSLLASAAGAAAPARSLLSDAALDVLEAAAEEEGADDGWLESQARDAAAAGVAAARAGSGGAAAGGGAQLPAALAALVRLARLFPPALAGLAPELAELGAAASSGLSPSEADRRTLFALARVALKEGAAGSINNAANAANTALALAAALPSLVLSTAPKTRQAAAALAEDAVRRLDAGGDRRNHNNESSSNSPLRRLAEATAQAGAGDGAAPLCEARRALQRWWRQLGEDDEEAVTWLSAVAASIAQGRWKGGGGLVTGAHAQGAAHHLPFSTPLAPARDLPRLAAAAGRRGAQLPPAASLLLAALLAGHPSPRVTAAAARALQQLALAAPAAAPAFLPVVLCALRRAVVAASSSPAASRSSASASAEACAALLGVLPAMASDPALAALSGRALQPLLSPHAPPLLRAAALRLTAAAWPLAHRPSTWASCEAAVAGYHPPNAPHRAPLALRLARASALRDLCSRAAREGDAAGGGRALALVPAVQDALGDPDDGVAALAAGALSALLRCDAIDFYSAWPVVCARLEEGGVERMREGRRKRRGGEEQPAASSSSPLARSPLLAARWVALLRHGALDAAARPDNARAALEAAWSAARSPEPRVRAAACRALAAYRDEAELEVLGALPAAAGGGGRGGSNSSSSSLASLSEYVRPLLTASSSSPGPLPGERAAARAAASLALVAVRWEHERRRSFASAAASAGAAAAGAAAAAAASTSPGMAELAAVRRRLVHVVPGVLLGPYLHGDAAAAAGVLAPSSSSSASAASAPRALAPSAAKAPSPGALLLLLRPEDQQPPPAAAAAYGRAFSAALDALTWSSAWTHPRAAAAAWERFAARWLGAASAAASRGAAPRQLLRASLAAVRQGVPSASGNAALALAGLAAAGALDDAQMDEALEALRGLLPLQHQTGEGVVGGAAAAPAAPTTFAGRRRPGSGAAAAGACAALALLAEHLHPADHVARRAVAASLMRALAAAAGASAAPSPSPTPLADDEFASAAAESLAHLSAALVGSTLAGRSKGLAGVGVAAGGDDVAAGDLATAGGAARALLLGLVAAVAEEGGSSTSPFLSREASRALVDSLSAAVEQAAAGGGGQALSPLRREEEALAAAPASLPPAAALPAAADAALALMLACACGGGSQSSSSAVSDALSVASAALWSLVSSAVDALSDRCADAAAAASARAKRGGGGASSTAPPEGLLSPAEVAEACAALRALPTAARALLLFGGDKKAVADACSGALALTSSAATPSSSSALDGRVGGAAAAAAADLCCQLQGGGDRVPGAPPSASEVAARLCELCGGSTAAGAAGGFSGRRAGGGGGKGRGGGGGGSGGAALKQGAAVGLGRLLGASMGEDPAISRLEALASPAGAAPLPWSLLSAAAGGDDAAGDNTTTDDDDASSLASAARRAERTLESLVLRDAEDPRLASLCGWLLALAAGGAGGGGGGGAGGGGEGVGGSGTSTTAASGSAAAAEAALVPLVAYPQDGAMRPLAEAALALAGPQQQQQHLPPLRAAAVLAALARAPRLPSGADWAGLCRTLLLSSSSRDERADRDLQRAALHLALAHAPRSPQLGLAAVLGAAVASPAAFAALGGGGSGGGNVLRADLLRALPVLARVLPPNRVAPLVLSVPDLAAVEREQVVGGGLSSARLAVAGWDGLAGLCRLHAARDPVIAGNPAAADALRAACARAIDEDENEAGGMLPQLPPSTVRLPGHFLSLLLLSDEEEEDDDAALRQPFDLIEVNDDDDEEEGADEDQEEDEAEEEADATASPAFDDARAALARTAAFPADDSTSLAIWRAAVRCLRRLRADAALALTDPHMSRAGVAVLARRCQLRCLLALAGALSHRDLAAVRAALLQQPASGDDDGPALLETTRAVAPLLGAATCAAPQAAQAQALAEVLAAGAELSDGPRRAVEVAAAMAAAWVLLPPPPSPAAGLASTSDSAAACAVAAMDAHLALGGGVSAVACLPSTLAALVLRRGADWRPSAEPLARALLRLRPLFGVFDAAGDQDSYGLSVAASCLALMAASSSAASVGSAWWSAASVSGVVEALRAAEE